MTEYELAGKGLHIMYLGEIVGLVSTVLALLALAMPVMAIVAFVGLLAGGVMLLIGLGKASSAHKGYNTALVLVLVSMVLSLLKFLGNSLGGDTTTSVINLISDIVSCVRTYYICKASGELLESKGEYMLAQKAEQIWKMVAACEGVAIVSRLVGWIPVLNILAILALFAAAIVSIVAVFMEISFYNNASKALLDE